MLSIISRAFAVVVACGVMPVAASAQTKACHQIWVIRNQIFKDAGYCFKTTTAINYFGNAGCRYDDEYDVPLSQGNRDVIRDLKAEAARLGCN